MQIGIIDYKAGNIHSVVKAFNHSGTSTKIIASVQDVSGIDGLVIPGVGAFGAGKQELVNRGLFSWIQEYAEQGHPLLGICLGMQLLFSESEEFELNAGLDLIPGRVVAIPEQEIDGEHYKVPHIGWNSLRMGFINDREKKSIIANIPEGEEFYFIHSFMALPEKKEHVLAYSNYGNCMLTAVVQKENIYGCQFHPEKSRGPGIQILRNFVDIAAGS